MREKARAVLALPWWMTGSIVAVPFTLTFGRLVLDESWSACAKDAYLAVVGVWLCAAFEWLGGVVSDIRAGR
jgi:hypothetical protein